MSASLDHTALAFLDLGDAFTKARLAGAVRREQIRFPSIVASRLLAGGEELSRLLLHDDDDVPRPATFDPTAYPRTRSFAGAERFVERVKASPPAKGARFAGRLAAKYGADRRLLGHDASTENLDALVRKVFMLGCAGERCSAEAIFVVDTGAKAGAISAYVSTLPRTTTLELRSYRRSTPRHLELTLQGTIVDAPTCIAAALPERLAPEQSGRVLLLDIGFLRSKLAIVAPSGCEHQAELPGLGTSVLVRRILRDGQDQGLVEDEFAVIEALERTSGDTLSVSDRVFSITAAQSASARFLQEELSLAVERAIVDHFGRHAERCRAAAILGGGARFVGGALARRLQAAGLGLDEVWVAPEPDHLVVEGARSLRLRSVR